MGHVSLLSAMDDCEQWDAAFSLLNPNCQDVHFTSAYARVHETETAKPFAIYYRDECGFAIKPVLLRELPARDITSIYGYGGWAFGFSPSEYLNIKVNAFLESQKIVSEYCCIHPLTPSPHFTGTIPHKVVVVLDLDRFSENSCSRNIRRGIKRGENVAKFFELEGKEAVSRFAWLYSAAMELKGASERFRHPISHWREYFLEDGVNARWFFVSGDKGGERALLVIGSHGTAYAHFLGSDGENKRDGLDELIYFKAALKLKQSGYRRFHLGGGRTPEPDDTLLAFKRAFGGEQIAVNRYERVLDAPTYNQLSEGKPSGWFPAYRA